MDKVRASSSKIKATTSFSTIRASSEAIAREVRRGENEKKERTSYGVLVHDQVFQRREE
jgi:hypothetical protein